MEAIATRNKKLLVKRTQDNLCYSLHDFWPRSAHPSSFPMPAHDKHDLLLSPLNAQATRPFRNEKHKNWHPLAQISFLIMLISHIYICTVWRLSLDFFDCDWPARSSNKGKQFDPEIDCEPLSPQVITWPLAFLTAKACPPPQISWRGATNVAILPLWVWTASCPSGSTNSPAGPSRQLLH